MAKNPRDKRRPVKDKIELGFDIDTPTLQIDQIVPLKIISEAAKTSRKFRQILASIKEIGIIEPPVVAKDRNSRGRYILLDGHLCIEALKQLGDDDLPPENWSRGEWGLLTITQEEGADDEEEIYGRTDHPCLEGGGGRSGDEGAMPPPRDMPDHVL